jgi:hypothetical protein
MVFDVVTPLIHSHPLPCTTAPLPSAIQSNNLQARASMPPPAPCNNKHIMWHPCRRRHSRVTIAHPVPSTIPCHQGSIKSEPPIQRIIMLGLRKGGRHQSRWACLRGVGSLSLSLVLCASIGIAPNVLLLMYRSLHCAYMA